MADSAVLPVGFLDPLPLALQPTEGQLPIVLQSTAMNAVAGTFAKQFWKAGDYEEAPSGVWDCTNGDVFFLLSSPFSLFCSHES